MKNIYKLTLFMLLFSFSGVIHAQELDFFNTQWLSDGTNGSNTSLSVNEGTAITVYSKAFEAGVTDAVGQGAGIECWIGFNSADTDPSTWDESAWQVANFGQDNGNDDEYNYSTSSTAVGTHYVATRWRLDSGSYTYGGASASNGGAWDGINNNNIGLTVNAVAQPLVITTSTCTSASEVRLTGPWWGWDPAGGPVAADNGDGTWTFTFDPAPTGNMEYLLIVDGVQENLISIMANGGDCAPVTDYANYANRRWDLGSGNITNTYGQCGNTCVAPVITLTGSDVTINNGDTYTDAGATATDNEEGDVSANIVVGGDTVDTSTDGTYTITYDVSDGAGNAATTVSRVVTVETPAYCDSEPTSNDGSGISSVAFNGTDFTSGGDITYEDFTATAVEAGQSTTASLNITFATGYTYDTHVWVDLNDDYNFDSSELLFTGESMGTNPTTLDASFLVPSDAPLGDHRVRIGTADMGQSTPNPCYSGSYGVTIDMTITVVEPPSCLAPSALTAANITFSSADLSWTAGGTETDYEYVVQVAGTGEPTAAGTAVAGATSVSLSALTDNTDYEVYVRSACAGGEFSTWTGPLNFTTDCASATSFNENFDSVSTPILPDCWSSIVSGVTSSFASVTTSTSADSSVPNGVSLYNSSSLSGDIMLVSPSVSNLSAGTHRLKVKVRSTHEAQDLEIGTLSDPTDSSTFAVLETLDTNSTFSEFIVDFSTYTGTDMYIGFRRLLTSTYTYVYLDDIVWEEIPSTPPGCAANFSNTLDASCGNFDFDISWDATDSADGYYITVGTTSGGSDIEASTDLGSATSYSFTNVQVATTYYYTVVPYNANGSATGCLEKSVTTATTGCHCDSEPTSNDGSGISSVAFNGTDFTSGGDITYEDFTATAVEAGQSTTASLNITFATGYTYDTHVWVDLNDDYNFDSSELLFTGESMGTNPTTLDASFLVPSDAPLGDHRVRIGTADMGQSTPNPCYSGSYGVTIDMTITVVEPPSCLAPSALTAANITFSSADLSWTAGGTETDYEYVVQVAGTGEPTAAGTAVAGATSVSLSALTDNTDYEVYVRSACAGGEFSSWTGPLNFTTEPAPIVPTYTNDFSTYPGEFWTEGTGTLADGPSGTTSAWGVDGFGNNGTTGAAKVNVYYSSFSGSGNNDWLISPMFDLSGGAYYLNLNVALTTYNSTSSTTFGAGDFVTLMVTEDNGSTWSELYRWDANNTPPSTGDAMPEIDLSSYTSITKFAFYAESATGNVDNDFFIDDFRITTTSLGVDDNSISLFNYFPNPVNDVLTIKAQNSVEDVKVFNMLGQMVLRQTPNTRDCTVDLSAMQAGAYFVQVSVDNSVETVRILKN